MGMKLNLAGLWFVLLFVSIGNAQSTDGVFDLTTYGAKPDADITQILITVWKDACASTNKTTKIVIPKATYKLGAVELVGPCKSPIEIQLQGILQAPVDLTGEGWVSFRYIDFFTLTGGGVLDGQGKLAWEKNDCDKNPKCDRIPMTLKLSFVTHAIVSDITSKDSKNFHVNVLGCKNLTFQNFRINAPGDSINSDGIHIGRSLGINVINTVIGTGDDCISLGDGSKQVTITNVTCGPGHGISVGSLGRYKVEEPVEGIIVKNCTLINTTNGLRIKSWPASPAAGTASDMHYEDVMMVNVNNPILIDQEYCPYNQCNKKSPSKVKISKVTFKNIRGTSGNAMAVKLICSAEVPCEGVELADIDLSYTGSEGPISSQCSNVKPVVSGKQNPPACSPGLAPTASPAASPTASLAASPTASPTAPTASPTTSPTTPTASPTTSPTTPTASPTTSPTTPAASPTTSPTTPTASPTTPTTSSTTPASPTTPAASSTTPAA